MTAPRHRADTRHATPAADKVAARLARSGSPSKRTRLTITALALSILGGVGVTLTVSETTPEPTHPAAAHVSEPAPAVAEVETRAPLVSRSFTRRPAVTVDVREYRVAQAIKQAEERAAEARRQARIAARKAEARRQARIAAKKAAAEAERIAAQKAAEQAAAAAAASTDPGTLRDMARQAMLDYGFGADQWTYLDQLVMRESGWNPQAQNASSGAYGLPQALPGSKMASAGADWQTNPVTQIRWMLGYIAERYGNPQNAWAHSQSVGWY
jgi:hypothetical protein